MKEYEAFVRYPKEDIISKEGDDIKLIIRDTERYQQRPVTARICRAWTEGMDRIWVLDPLGRPYGDKPFGIKIVKEEDEDKIVDSEYQKARLRV